MNEIEQKDEEGKASDPVDCINDPSRTVHRSALILHTIIVAMAMYQTAPVFLKNAPAALSNLIVAAMVFAFVFVFIAGWYSMRRIYFLMLCLGTQTIAAITTHRRP